MISSNGNGSNAVVAADQEMFPLFEYIHIYSDYFYTHTHKKPALVAEIGSETIKRTLSHSPSFWCFMIVVYTLVVLPVVVRVNESFVQIKN